LTYFHNSNKLGSSLIQIEGGDEMLYMVVMTHNPEAGPLGSKTVADNIKNVMQKRAQVMSKLGIKDVGEWMDISGHVTYLLADVTDAHVFTQMLGEYGLLGWIKAEIHPVVTTQESVALLQ
jgi:hypothetical protein